MLLSPSGWYSFESLSPALAWISMRVGGCLLCLASAEPTQGWAQRSQFPLVQPLPLEDIQGSHLETQTSWNLAPEPCWGWVLKRAGLLSFCSVLCAETALSTYGFRAHVHMVGGELQSLGILLPRPPLPGSFHGLIFLVPD